MEKRGKAKVKSKPKSTKSKSTRKSQRSKPEPTPIEEYLMGPPEAIYWARKINGRDDLDWAPHKMNGQDDVELLLTKETHYMSCLSKQTQEEVTRKKT
ncbi:hypothetical protein Tco_0341974 [Tanacetum coccineum]